MMQITHTQGGIKIGLLHQNVPNLPKMRQIATGWDRNWTVTPKCPKSPKNDANFHRIGSFMAPNENGPVLQNE